ncbi:hypothetical protein A5766_21350 [Gordonia sp. 852002-51296_SCH5728562-b]|nr:hypothetical protein A5766_21350 [Gordonia sp. 852002-51296_SCH5728562-b]
MQEVLAIAGSATPLMHGRLAESDSLVVMDIAERKAFRDYGTDVRTVASEPQKVADSAGGGSLADLPPHASRVLSHR